VELARLLAGALAPSALVLATALVAGRWALRRLVPDEGLRSLPIATTTGLGLVGLGLLGLGLVHLLRADVILALAAVVHVAAARWWWRVGRAAESAIRRASWPAGVAAIGLLVALGPVIALALYPPVDYDATVYHLAYARQFARLHAVPFLEDLQPPIFPQLQELLFTAGFLLGSEPAPHLVQLASVLLVALLLLTWDPGGVPPVARQWATALWLGTPFALAMGAIAYVDAGMTLQTTGAVYAWTRARHPVAGRGGWWAVAGACAGFAAATKYLGLIFVVAGLVAAAAAARAGRRAAPVLAFAAGAVVAAGPWYLRLYLETGNPVFPYFSRWFGSGFWDPALEPTIVAHVPAVLAVGPWSLGLVSVGEGLAFLVRLPWDTLVHRDRFFWYPPLSPYYPLLMPFLLPVAVARRATRPVVLTALAYAVICLLAPREPRYWLPVWPLLDVAMMAAAVAWLAPRRPVLVTRPAVVLGIALLLAVPGWAFAWQRVARQGPPPAAPAARDRFLAPRVPGYDAVAWLNRRHGADYTVYALYGARLAYYAEGRLRGAWIGPARYRQVLQRAADPAAFDAELGRLGADYLLAITDQTPFVLPDTPAWRARFGLVHRGPGFALYRRTGGRGAG
jgi:hypothetical protein